MSDDEKFFFKGSADKKGIDYYNRMTYNDIIACGFDPDRTLIFSNTATVCLVRIYTEMLVKMEQSTTGNQ